MKIFLQSLKLKKDFLKIVSYDIFYYAVCVGLIALYIYVVLPKTAFYYKAVTFVQSLQVPSQEASFEGITLQAEELGRQLLFFMWLTFAFVLALVCNYTFFKGLIWSRLIGKKFTIATFFQYLFTNSIFIALAMIMLYLTNAFVPQSLTPHVVLVYVLLALYFINILHPMVQLESGISLKAIKKLPKNRYAHMLVQIVLAIVSPILTSAIIFGKTVWYGIVYVYRLLMPFLVMVVLFVVLHGLLWLLKQWVLPYVVFLVVYVLALVLYFNWCKVYMKHLLVES